MAPRASPIRRVVIAGDNANRDVARIGIVLEAIEKWSIPPCCRQRDIERHRAGFEFLRASESAVLPRKATSAFRWRS